MAKKTASTKNESTANQSKKTATPKQTGGGGGIFEEKAIAYFLAHLMTGETPFDHPLGKLIKVETQRPAAIWQLDDLLLTVQGHIETKVAFSVKSNGQITSNGFPVDFVRATWEQILHVQSNVFNAATDFVGFITAPLGPTLNTNIHTLLKRVQQQDHAILAQDIYKSGAANEQMRRLYESFACPADLAEGHSLVDVLPGRALKYLVWLPFDLDATQSQVQLKAQGLLRSVLVSGDAIEANCLWDALCLVAKDMRPHAGSRTLAQLGQELRHRFRLKTFPDHDNDLKIIRREVERAALQVSALIGGKLELTRIKERETLHSYLSTHQAVVLLGPSGTGKSVVARMEALERIRTHPVLWFDAELLRGKTLGKLSQEWGLYEDLGTLIETVTAEGLCVIDRLDKVYENDNKAFALVAELIRLLRLGAPASPWKLLLPCIIDEWERVQRTLSKFGVKHGLFGTLEVGVLTIEDQQQVWEAFPHLTPLRTRHHLNQVLLRPKVLDILAHSSSPVDQVLGEPSVAKLWLNNLIQQPGGIRQQVYATELATLQADTLQNTLPGTALPPLNIETVDELILERVCTRRSSGVSFEHDLYGDWMRLNKLSGEAQSGRLTEFLCHAERIYSPLWQRTLRLYGASLLDEHPNQDMWLHLFEQLESKTIGQDVLLESIWRAAEPEKQLRILWPQLVTEEGRLLHRLLVRFLHTATRPNERLVEFIKQEDPDPEVAIYAATLERIPLPLEWPPLLEIVYQHRLTLPLQVWGVVAQLAETWLRYFPRAQYSAQAAAIAVSLGNNLLAGKQQLNIRYLRGNAEKQIYLAVLLAAEKEPAAVTQIVLEAAGRRPTRFATQQSNEQELRNLDRAPFYYPLRSQWPAGPKRRVDDELREAAIKNTVGLTRLLWALPAVALEVTLALLIEEPKPKSSSKIFDSFGLEAMRDWPTYYLNGPFLSFLKYNQPIGLELVLQLEKRAVAGWEESYLDSILNDNDADKTKQVVPSIWLDLPTGSREVTGDESVYEWHRAIVGRRGVITGALMALEKHIYDLLDEGIDVTSLLEDLLAQATSVAMLGTLVVVGKRKPELFRGVLQPLLGIPELFFLDQLLLSRTALDGGGLIRVQKQWEAVNEWKTMPHRKLSLLSLAQSYLLNHQSGQAYFCAARERWKSRLSSVTIADFYENCIYYFHIDNYRFSRSSNGSIQAEYCMPPEQHAKQTSSNVPLRLNSILLSTALKHKQLDEAANGSLSESQLTHLWSEVEYLNNIDEATLSEASQINTPADVIMGAIAIFFLRGRDWLRQRPEIEAEAREALLAGANAFWTNRNELLGQLSSGFGMEISRFIARALPELWLEQPYELRVREAIGQAVLVFPAEAVIHILGHTAPRRTELGEDYYRMIHLVILRAYWEIEFMMSQREIRIQQADFGTVHDIIKVLLLRRDQLLMDFTTSKLSHGLPSLPVLIGAHPILTKQVPSETLSSQEEPEWHLFNVELLKAAFGGLPTPVEDIAWLPHWLNTLQYTLDRLQPASNRHVTVLEGYPSSWDEWLFQQVAKWLPHLEESEARMLWEPILALGLYAHTWVMVFLRDWTQVALAKPDLPSVPQIWLQMIMYAKSSPTWLREELYWRDSGELWRAMLSLDWYTSWKAKHEKLALALRTPLAEWASLHCSDGSNAAGLVDFLAQPGARLLIPSGLRWISPYVNEFPAEASYWVSVENNLASLLAHTWQVRNRELRQDGEAFSAFRALLGLLVNRRHPVGLQLNEFVGQA